MRSTAGVFIRKKDAGAGGLKRFREVRLGSGEPVQERGENMEDIPPEHGTVRAVFIPVKGVCIQNKEGVFPERIHFPVHEKITPVGKNQHQFNAFVVMQAVHAPLVILLVLNAVIARFHKDLR